MTEPTYPTPSSPVSALVLPGGGAEAHSRLHGRAIGLHENVQAFGGVGDGVTDDTAAIQAAIDKADSTGKSLFFPPGRYKITSTIDLSSKNYYHWVGGNHGNTSLIQFDRAPQIVIDGSTIASGPAVHFDGGASFAGGLHTMENITFIGKEIGVECYGTARMLFNNCGFQATTSTGTADNCAVLWESSFWSEFRDCAFHSPNTTTRHPSSCVVTRPVPTGASSRAMTRNSFVRAWRSTEPIAAGIPVAMVLVVGAAAFCRVCYCRAERRSI